jgi:predicted Zn-dependent peptidase
MPPGSAALPLAPSQLKTLSRWPFADFVTRAWNPDGAALVIDGSLSLSMTEDLVREIFEPWEGRSPQPVHPRPVAPPHDASPKVIENQDAAVTTVRMACRLPPGLDAKGLDPLAGNVLLAQALETTLDDDLRQSRGVTYGVSVDTTRFLTEDNALTVQVRLDPRDRQQAARLLLERLASLDGLLWSERDVDRARWHVAKERLGTTLDSEAVAAWLASVGAAGVPVQAVFPKALASAPVHVVDDAWAACVETLAVELEGERSSLEALLKK